MEISEPQIDLICSYYISVVGYKPERKTIEEMAAIISRKMYENLIGKHPEYKEIFAFSEQEMFRLECKVYETLRFAITRFILYREREISKWEAFSQIERAYTRIGKIHKTLIDKNLIPKIGPSQFADVGHSLIFAIRGAAKKKKIWSDDMKTAWLALYIDLTYIMKTAIESENGDEI